MILIYDDLVKDNKTEFIAKVQVIAANLGISPHWLMAIMYIESKLDHKAKNPGSSAVGLIQFMSNTAVSLGTTREALLAMNNIQQLDYVAKYYDGYKNKLKHFIDCYFAVFYPAAIGKYFDYQLGKIGLSRAKIAAQNPGMDLDKNEEITRQEVETKILYSIDTKYHQYLK